MSSTRIGRGSYWPLGIVAVALTLGVAQAAPTAYHPALGIVDADLKPISVTGSGFGTPQAGSTVTLSDGLTSWIVPSTDHAILIWNDSQIVVKATPSQHPLSVAVTAGAVTTATIPIQYYVHDWFETDSPRDPGANASPLAIAVDSKSRAWLTEEFRYYYLKMIDLRTGTLSRYDTPFPANGQNVFCGAGGATGGEDVIVDSKGRVWTTEDGNVFCADSNQPNHSRILMFDPRMAPSSTNPRVFNVPGNHNSVTGVAYDQRQRHLWFTESKSALPARLGSFDPLLGNLSTDNKVDCPWPGTCDFATAGLACNAVCTNLPTRGCGTANDCQFCQPDHTCNDPPGRACTSDVDCHGTCQIPSGAAFGGCSNMCRFCSTDAQCVADPSIACGICNNAADRACRTVHDCVLAEHVCASPTDDQSACMAEYREPDFHTASPAHLTIDRHGVVWYTNYLTGNDIRRFDPSTGEFRTFNLPRPPVKDPATAFGSWPWQIFAVRTGDILFTAYASGGVGRVIGSMIKNSSIDCSNPVVGHDFCGNPQYGPSPCVEVKTVPGADDFYSAVHSLAVDTHGNVWFGTSAAFDDPGQPASVGFVSKDFTQVVLLPPLTLFPFISHGSECLAPGEFVNFSGAGIAYDRRSKSILVADYCRKRVVRLRPAGGAS